MKYFVLAGMGREQATVVTVMTEHISVLAGMGRERATVVTVMTERINVPRPSDRCYGNDIAY